MKKWITRRDLIVPALALGLVGVVAVGKLRASDHQQTVFTEVNPRYDITDVYAFPAATPGRIALVMMTSSPLTPANTAGHKFADISEGIYQIKADLTGDAVEDLVFQISFTGPLGAQIVSVRGPAVPNETGVVNTFMTSGNLVTGPVGSTTLGNPAGVQVYAGPRNDPFFIDLEQFFRIIPDRKPVTGPLALLPNHPTASSFRAPGSAVDFLRGINGLAIVIEVPKTLLTSNNNHPKFGIWGTVNLVNPPANQH